MTRKSYVILDDQNRWLSTGHDMTEEEITADIIETRNNLIEDEGERNVKLYLYEIVGEPVDVTNRGK
jgi:hypothetical protein